jgi:hypothetical protein
MLLNSMKMTFEGGGLVVMDILLSGLGCGCPIKSRNGKPLGLDPMTPTHDPLVPSWD